MKLFALATLVTLSIAMAVKADEPLPATLMTTRGKLLMSEDFAGPLPPLTGKPVGFASGFGGWRCNTGVKSGQWEVVDGTFKGSENPEAHHPATASYGIQFKDAIIQCDVRMNDVPENGRRYRYLQLKATDTKDYVCLLAVSAAGLTGKPFDDSRINPATKQRMEGKPTQVATPVKLGEWHTIVMEIKGGEVVGSIDGKALTFSDPLVGVDKHSIMLVAGMEGSFRHLRIWEALPNPEWPKNKAGVATAK